MKNLETEIESLIDAYGLGSVRTAISIVCREKADHIRSSYQDEVLANSWERAANWFAKSTNMVSNFYDDSGKEAEHSTD